jgi:ribosomal protein L29
MKKADITKAKDTELTKRIAEAGEELREFRFNTAGSREKNTKKARGIKREIARLKTELTKRKHEQG